MGFSSYVLLPLHYGEPPPMFPPPPQYKELVKSFDAFFVPDYIIGIIGLWYANVRAQDTYFTTHGRKAKCQIFVLTFIFF